MSAVAECYRKLCHNEATMPIDVRDSREELIFKPRPRTSHRPPRHYELCDDCFADFFPRGHGWMDRANAARLYWQCHSEPVEVTS
jgi:hypothetical protein